MERGLSPWGADAKAGADDEQTPTDRWLEAVEGMPPLEGPAGTAERLLLLLHYGIDWKNSWVGERRSTYWDKLLPDRVLLAAIPSGSLRRFWREVTQALESRPRNAAERAEVEQLLRADDEAVLEVLRWEAEALLLRTRLTADAVRFRRQAASAADDHLGAADLEAKDLGTSPFEATHKDSAI
ncbi:hypothetical protein [Wenjunlia tyrosinilytica]|jgi:hypothetical protein|uniref:Uncharacterized protein n=1 Tax=Wenjunlia tyrosinilytica TaxID=1544741 RepID=A0A917ZYV1_9ACTN|nr:hypothetical protein [Wenjunlia tyrosinilytica]GGO97997.1 hypothetical protein GCM10012280_61100 [Wenjunlia tyrosinilytica]